MKKYNNRGIGTLLGLLAGPLIGFALVCLAYAIFTSFTPGNILWFMSQSNNYMSSIISLSLLGNLLFFYIFLNKEKWYTVQGIIMGTMVYFPFIIYLRFIA